MAEDQAAKSHDYREREGLEQAAIPEKVMVCNVVFGQSARSRWDILLHGSVINRFLSEVRGATVQVVPLQD